MKRTFLAISGGLALCVAAAIFWAPMPGAFPFIDLGTFDTFLFTGWTVVTLASAGAVLLWKASIGWDREKLVVLRRRQMLPDVALRCSSRFRRLRPDVRRPQLPDFGMYWGWIMMVQMVVFWVMMTPRVPTGLQVRVPSLYAAERPRAPESESLGVYVANGDKYYVNGQLVARDQLRARLQEELGRRSFWIVYFEGDDDVAYGQVVYAIDTIRGLGAQAYLISPRIREELSATNH